MAFVAAPRVVLAVGKDPADETRQILVTIKNNLAPKAPALRFHPDPRRAGLVAGPVAMDEETLLGQPADREEREEKLDAEQYLRGILAAGDVSATEGEKGARAHGIALRTLDRARRRLGVRAYQIARGWMWSLPSSERHAPLPSGALASCQQPGEKTAETTGTSPQNARTPGVGSGGVLKAPRLIEPPAKSYLRQVMTTDPHVPPPLPEATP